MFNLELIRLAFDFLNQKGKKGNMWFKTEEDLKASRDTPKMTTSCQLVPGVITAFNLLAEVVGVCSPASECSFHYDGAIYIMEEMKALLSTDTKMKYGSTPGSRDC